MASPQAETLRKAIEGYRGVHAGEKGHEEIMDHLNRVYSQMQAGRKGDEDSPGKRAVLGAVEREIPSERSHEGGGGQTTSNDVHGHGMEFARHPEVPGKIAPDFGGEDTKMNAVAGVKSGGQIHSNRPGPGFAPGNDNFRTIAAAKAREAMMMKEHVPSKGEDNNVKSNPKRPFPPETPRVGEAPSPAKGPMDTSKGEYERVPAYVAKEPVATEYARAAEGVRKLLKAPRR